MQADQPGFVRGQLIRLAPREIGFQIGLDHIERRRQYVSNEILALYDLFIERAPDAISLTA